MPALFLAQLAARPLKVHIQRLSLQGINHAHNVYKSISHLKTNAAEMLEHLAEQREPFLIAQNGEPTLRYLGMNGAMDLYGGKIMNRTVLVLKMLTGVFALAVFLNPASASEKPESPVAPVNIAYKKYLSEGDFFAVLIPDGWSKEEKDFAYAYTRTGDKVCGVELSGPHNGDVRPTISVLYYAYGQFFKNHGEYISLKAGSFTRLAPEKDVSITNTAVAGREAKEFEIKKFELIPLPFDPPDSKEGVMYEIVPPAKKVTVMERYLVVPAEKGFYVLSYRAPEGIAKEYESVFDKIIGSFEPHEK